MRKTTLILLGVCAALFLMNPDKDDFENYLEQKIERDMDFESKAGQIFGEVLGGGLAGLLANQAKVQNFQIFSIYKLDDDDRYLGVASNFFKL